MVIGSQRCELTEDVLTGGCGLGRARRIVGGTSAADEPFSVIERFDPRSATWSEITLSGDALPAEVDAAALTADSYFIYFVDHRIDRRDHDRRADADESASRRLARVGLPSGVVETIATLEGDPRDHWAVASTWDGQVVVVNSNDLSRRWHAALGLVASGGFDGEATADGDGAVVGDITADDTGVSLLLRDGEHFRTLGVRYEEFQHDREHARRGDDDEGRR